MQRWAGRQESDEIINAVILNPHVGYNIQGRTGMASRFWSLKKKQKRAVKQ